MLQLQPGVRDAETSTPHCSDSRRTLSLSCTFERSCLTPSLGVSAGRATGLSRVQASTFHPRSVDGVGTTGARHYSGPDSAMRAPGPCPVRLCMDGGLPVSPSLKRTQPAPTIIGLPCRADFTQARSRVIPLPGLARSVGPAHCLWSLSPAGLGGFCLDVCPGCCHALRAAVPPITSGHRQAGDWLT